MKIFISYSSKDERFARRLNSSLLSAGYQTWFDRDDIPVGADWSDAVDQGLRECQLLILIMTPDSMASSNVNDEWKSFLDQEKQVIPILLHDTEKHFQLRRKQHLDFRNITDYTSNLQHLYERLKKEAESLEASLSPFFTDTAQVLPNKEKLGEVDTAQPTTDKYTIALEAIKSILQIHNDAVSEIAKILDENYLLGEVRNSLLLLAFIAQSSTEKVYEEILFNRFPRYDIFQNEMEKLDALLKLFFSFENLPAEYDEEYIGQVQSLILVRECEICLQEGQQEKFNNFYSQALAAIKTPDDVRRSRLQEVREMMLREYTSEQLFAFWNEQFDILKSRDNSLSRTEFIDEVFSDLHRDVGLEVSHSLFKRLADMNSQDISNNVYQNLVSGLCSRTVDFYIGQGDYTGQRNIEELRKLEQVMSELTPSAESSDTFYKLYGKVTHAIHQFESLQRAQER